MCLSARGHVLGEMEAERRDGGACLGRSAAWHRYAIVRLRAQGGRTAGAMVEQSV